MASFSAASIDKFIIQNRYAVLAGCSLLTYVWVASEGRPLKFFAKHLFRGVLAMVPTAMVAQEKLKLRDKIEASTIGDSLDGETLYLQLPQEGAFVVGPTSAAVRRPVFGSSLWGEGRLP